MKVGDLVRCLVYGDYGIITEGEVAYDGWYRVLFANGAQDFRSDDNLEVVNESR